MSDCPSATTLLGRYIRLEPLSADHTDRIARAAADPRIWKHTAFGASADAYIAAALAQRSENQIPFVVMRSGQVVGMSRLFAIDAQHKRIEIGYTWYTPKVWGTAVNPEAKLLLMTHCFERWGARRVQFKIDHENLHSQAAIAKLGAMKEGVLRAHMIRPDGTRRDSVMYSVTREEWPAVKAGLEARLA